MPCYSISPVARRSVHYSPFFGFQALSPAPRVVSPLFRSFEQDIAQFDSFFREIDQQINKARIQPETFQPRFDIKEESDKFVLNGELPGVQPEHLSIEFVDRNTMVVKGKVVRQETHGTPPAAQAETAPAVDPQPQVEDSPQEDTTMSGALADSASDTASTTNYHKASVQDEEIEDNSTTSEVNTPTASTTGAETDTVVATAKQQQEVAKAPEQSQSQSHYWVSERTVGEFSRAFRFPGQVNQEGVTASLKDGILTVGVPKIRPQVTRRKIEVQGL